MKKFLAALSCFASLCSFAGEMISLPPKTGQQFICKGRFFSWLGEGKLEIQGATTLRPNMMSYFKAKFNGESVFDTQSVFADANYKPTSKYENYNRFKIAERHIDGAFNDASFAILMPKKYDGENSFTAFITSKFSDGGTTDSMNCNFE